MTEFDRWGELDETSVRKSLRDVFEDMPDDYDRHAAALKTFRRIVHEELARAYSESLGVRLIAESKDTRADAQALADAVNSDLADLGLSIRHPESGDPSRFVLASSPPSGLSESWLALQSVNSTTRPGKLRLARPVPALELMPTPLPPTPPHRSMGR